MSKYRVERIAEQILRDVTDIVQKDVKDPRVQQVNFTDVNLTGDMQYATIFYSTLKTDAETKATAEEGLKRASGLIRSKLAERLQLFKAPEIEFKRDESIEYGAHIDALLEKIKHEDKD